MRARSRRRDLRVGTKAIDISRAHSAISPVSGFLQPSRSIAVKGFSYDRANPTPSGRRRRTAAVAWSKLPHCEPNDINGACQARRLAREYTTPEDDRAAWAAEEETHHG